MSLKKKTQIKIQSQNLPISAEQEFKIIIKMYVWVIKITKKQKICVSYVLAKLSLSYPKLKI